MDAERNFETLVNAEEQRLVSALSSARQRFDHRGERGGSLERAFRSFLASYLPRRLTVAHGEVIDTYGARSGQTDVLILNEDQPAGEGEGVAGLFIVEGVSAAGEVKSVLDKSKLRDAVENAKKFKKLRATESNAARVYASKSDLERFYPCPPYFLFAYESKMDRVRVALEMQELDGLGPEPGWDSFRGVMPSLDAIFLLGEGRCLNLGDGKGAIQVPSPDVGVDYSGWIPVGRSNHGVLANLLFWLNVTMPRVSRQLPPIVQYLTGSNSMATRNCR